MTSREAIERAADLCGSLFDLDAAQPVRPYRTPEEIERMLPLKPGARGLDADQLDSLLLRALATTPATGSNRFVNQLFAGRLPEALLGEIVAAAANNSMYTFKAAGAQVLIERELLRHMGAKAGYTQGEGAFTPGGSLSNLAAMIVARNEYDDDCRDTGLGSERLTMYTSDESHYSIRKNAGMIGIGRDQVRFVPTDSEGRMDPDALRRVMYRDMKEGRTPFMINATAGTTVLGAFDPLPAIHAVAQEIGVWLHVDGAFGGTALLSDTHRHLLDGLHLADSFTWDAHKMMGVPLTCSVVLMKSKGRLRASFDETATYLFQQDDDELNPGTRSMQCGRRNDALKLWTAWHALGDDGYAERTDRQFELARSFADRIEADDDLVLSKQPQSVTVCFEVRGKPSDAICDTLDKSGRMKVGFGIVDQRRVVRMVLINPSLTEDDLDAMLAEIKAVAEELPDADNALTKAELNCRC